MAHCNLVTIPKNIGKKKPGDDKTEEFCNLAGLNLIELHHNKQTSELSMTCGGFQAVKIVYTGGKNGRAAYECVPTRTLQGDDIKTTQQLIFKPEEYTNHLKAWCPDTKYNRDYIAKTLYSNVRVFTVADTKIAKEIDKLAIDKGYNKKPKVREVDVLVSQEKTIAEQRAQIETLERRLADSYDTPTLVAEKRSKEEKMRDEAKEYVHKQESEWLKKTEEKFKKQGKDLSTIYISKAYRDTIVPKIDLVVKEMKTGKFNPEG